MPSHKAFIPKEQSNISSPNQSSLISAKNVRSSSLTIKLGLATSIAAVIYLPISGEVAAAKNLNSESAETTNFSNQFSTSPTNSNSTTKHRRSAFLPRIFSLITSPLRNKATNLANLAQATPDQQNNFFVGQVYNNLDSSYLKHQAVSSLVANDYKSSALPSTAALPAASSNFKIHKVKPGDTVEQIARKYQVSSAKLVKLNSLKNANIIQIDRELKIPARATDSALFNADTNQENLKLASTKLSAKVLEDDGERLDRHNNNHDSATSTDDPYISKLRSEIEELRNEYRHQAKPEKQNISNHADVSIGENEDSEVQSTKTDDTATSIPAKHDLQPDLLDKDAIALQLPPLPPSEEYLPKVFNGYAWPAKGALTSGYGWRWGRLHAGVDIAAPIGTPVVAAAAGEVIEAGWNSGGYGNLIELQHLDGSVTLYAHNNRILVNVGQRVNQGEQIGEMGSTGYSTGPHVHFEIHPKGHSAVDPMAFLNRQSLANVY